MRHLLLPFLALMVSMGCVDEKAPSTALTSPPSGQGVFEGENGEFRTNFGVLDVIEYGQTKSGRVSFTRLKGYLFAADEGHKPSFSVSGPKTRIQLAIYGPQGPTGLWGESLVFETNRSTIQLTGWTAPLTGQYFALIRPLDEQDADITFKLECEQCSKPTCESAVGCDLFCPGGLATTDDGQCLKCECQGASCPISGCPGEQSCVFECGGRYCGPNEACINGQCSARNCGETACADTDACIDGECSARPFQCIDALRLCQSMCPAQTRPVCAQHGELRRDFPNGCYAECEDAMFLADGPCPKECQTQDDCPDGLICDASQRCRPQGCDQCPVGGLRDTVCGVDGRTYSNQCRLECAGVQLGYTGPCVANPCREDRDCGLGRVCAPVVGPLRGNNTERCQADMDDPDCIKECRDLPTCQPNSDPCPSVLGQATVCYPIGERAGLCLRACTPNNGRTGCTTGLCARLTLESTAVDGTELAPAASGVCLPDCTRDEDCPGQLRCLEDILGQRVCQACACETAERQPICHEGDVFDSTCSALCNERKARGWSRVQETEDCDGKDNDCDGEVDEKLVRECGDGLGECAQVQSACDNGQWTECAPAKNPLPEICDGKDNDCDGRTDENAGEVCGSDVGQCQTGRRRCLDGVLQECVGDIGGVDEVCDGRDNDCDQKVDEGFSNQPELCDGKDNDCDGKIDEGDPLPNLDVCRGSEECAGLVDAAVLSEKCGLDVGECKPGIRFCKQGIWSECFGSIDRSVEQCDGLDNDCDRRVDEDAPAPVIGPDSTPDEIEAALMCRRDCTLCPPLWDPVCGMDGTVYPNRCEARCRQVSVQDYQNCLAQPDEAVGTQCRQDDDCLVSGCVGQFCASEIGLAQCYRPSDAAQCFIRGGQCGCVEGRCVFGQTDDVSRCLMNVRN